MRWPRRAPAVPRHAAGWRRRAAYAIVALAVLAAGYYGWFRDSSLVAVREVRVEGALGADRARVAEALTRAARGMTTLHVQPDRLGSAVASFPEVASVSADPSFPHGLTIHVTERPPVLVAVAGNRKVPVAGDGTLLPAVAVKGGGPPEIRVDSIPAAGRLSGDPLQEALAVGAAPAPLGPLIEKVAISSDYGVLITIKGIELRFGSGQAAAAKWAAVAAILADRKLTSLAYLDVRVPERPAVGG